MFLSLDGQLDLNEVGGKAFNLSFLTQKKIPVPTGFVVPNSVYTAYKKGEITQADLKKGLKKIIGRLKSKYIMVRSSAIGEDSEDNSFAGQLDSYQADNELDAIIENILKCWASLDNERVKVYQEQKNYYLQGIGVVVQEMIEPEYSGVLFTKDPGGEASMYLEYVEGHAEKLVQGEVDPERLYLSHDIDVENVPFDVKKLVELTHSILDIYKQVPQDIEWTYKEEQIYFVQSRPITKIKEKVYWSNTNVNENYPEKLSPLIYSIARQSYYFYFKNLAIKLGALGSGVSKKEAEFYSIIGLWGDRMYYKMSSIHSVINLSPFESLTKKSFDHFVGYLKENKLQFQHWKIIQKINFVLRILVYGIRLPRFVAYMERTILNYRSKAENAKHLSDLNILYHEFLDIRFNQWYRASFADLFAMLTHGALGKLCQQINPEKYMGYQNGLIQAIPNLISNRPIHELWEINGLIDQEEAFRALFESTSAEEVWSTLQAESKYLPLKTRIDRYLSEWGFRCSGELTFLSENYIERPESFIQLLLHYRQSGPENPSLLFKQKRVEQDELYSRINKEIDGLEGKNSLSKFLTKIALSFLVKFTSYSISCRERVRLKQAELYYRFKNICRRLATHSKFRDFLGNQNDIFYLEYPEISRILAGDEMDHEYLKQLIELRKAKIDRSEQQTDNFYTFFEDKDQRTFGQDTSEYKEGDKSLKGLPACGGTITGQIKVLETVHELNKIKKGDILVTRQTDPGWISIFPLISGLIIEKGGMLSHGAIVAREFGHPAVVGIANVTEILKDGQVVTIDGDLGIISWD
jgi:pyruvate,water dikinase